MGATTTTSADGCGRGLCGMKAVLGRKGNVHAVFNDLIPWPGSRRLRRKLRRKKRHAANAALSCTSPIRKQRYAYQTSTALTTAAPEKSPTATFAVATYPEWLCRRGSRGLGYALWFSYIYCGCARPGRNFESGEDELSPRVPLVLVARGTSHQPGKPRR